MHLYKTTAGFIIEKNSEYRIVDGVTDWGTFINRDDLRDFIEKEWKKAKPLTYSFESADNILAPVSSQEVWAAGVTYHSSRLARMEESQDSGGGDFYSRVYQADRPEIFFKATPNRVVGHRGSFRIRQDSTWDVPEPELTLFATSSGKIVAYTIGNDVSSRSIEGENPLYLPQAKTFDKCACLGPGLYIPECPIPQDAKVSIKITRNGEEKFCGETLISQMKRTPDELIEYLFRECSFTNGVFLMTGTGIVPEKNFSLRSGDVVVISIDFIGTLINSVE